MRVTGKRVLITGTAGGQDEIELGDRAELFD